MYFLMFVCRSPPVEVEAARLPPLLVVLLPPLLQRRRRKRRRRRRSVFPFIC
jgi:hypothetical protein